MKIRCKYDELVQISDLKQHPKNPNVHTGDQVVRLAQILDYQGWRYPVKVSRLSGFVTSGHGRLMAAKHNGWEKVPVNFQEYESEEQEYADLVSDNSIASWSDLDMKLINLEVPDLGPDFDIDLLGIKDFTIDPSEKDGECDADETPEPAAIPSVKSGELYVLGSHRLLCGDSTDSSQVQRLMNGEKADMVYTDPPYGMNLDTDYDAMSSASMKVKGNKYSKVVGDDVDYDPAHIFNSFPEAKEVFLWGADYFYNKLPPHGSWLVWVKRNENMLDIIGNHFEVCWSKSKHHRKVSFKNWSGVTARNREFDREHPTEKPISLNVEVIEGHSKRDELVVDVFSGVGTTLIACEKTNRKCYGMEIDPIYCGVILDRWAKFTGLDPHREDGVAWSEIKASN